MWLPNGIFVWYSYFSLELTIYNPHWAHGTHSHKAHTVARKKCIQPKEVSIKFNERARQADWHLVQQFEIVGRPRSAYFLRKKKTKRAVHAIAHCHRIATSTKFYIVSQINRQIIQIYVCSVLIRWFSVFRFGFGCPANQVRAHKVAEGQLDRRGNFSPMAQPNECV